MLSPQGKLKREIRLRRKGADQPRLRRQGWKDGFRDTATRRVRRIVSHRPSGPRGLFAGCVRSGSRTASGHRPRRPPGREKSELFPGGRFRGANPQPKIYLIQIAGISCRIVSSRRPGDETILLRTKPFSPWRADVPKRWLINNLSQRSAANAAITGRLSCGTSIAINAAARQGIIAAQATSDEMLLESIADGGRTAMHILYSRHNVRVYRFVLRIVRDATHGGRPRQPGLP